MNRSDNLAFYGVRGPGLGLALLCALAGCVLSMPKRARAQQTQPVQSTRLEGPTELGDERLRAPALVQGLSVGKSFVVSVDTLGHVTVYKRPSGRLHRQFRIASGNVLDVCLSGDERGVLVGSDTGLWHVPFEQENVRQLLPLPTLVIRAEEDQVVALTVGAVAYGRLSDNDSLRLVNLPDAPVATVGFVQGKPAVIGKQGQLFVRGPTAWQRLIDLPPAAEYALVANFAVCVDGARVRVVSPSGTTASELTLHTPATILRATAHGILLALRARKQRKVVYIEPGKARAVATWALPHRCLASPVTVDAAPARGGQELWVAVGATVEPSPSASTVELSGHKDAVSWLAFSADARRIFSADGHELLVSDWSVPKVLARRPLRRCPRLPLVTYNPQADLVAYARGERHVVIERGSAQGLQELCTIPGQENAIITAIAWLHGPGTSLAVACYDDRSGNATAWLYELAPATRRATYRLLTICELGKLPITQIASVSAAALAVLDARGRVRICERSRGRMVCTETGSVGADLVGAAPNYVLGTDASEGYDRRCLSCEVFRPLAPSAKRQLVDIEFTGVPAQSYRARLLAARTLSNGTLCILAAAGPSLHFQKEDSPLGTEWCAGERLVTAAAISRDGKLLAAGLTSGVVVLLRP